MERFRYLFNRYVTKTGTIVERLEFQEMLLSKEYDNELKSLIDSHFSEFVALEHEAALGSPDEILLAVLSADDSHKSRNQKFDIVKLWSRIAVAASIVLAVTLGGYFYFNKQNSKVKQISTYSADIAQGKNSATLTLADGHRIVLSNVLKGKVAEQAGVNISKTSDGQVVYEMQSVSGDVSAVASINVLSTSNGEQYQVVLPDGSKVWLNAASELQFPAAFGSGSRLVKLKGEAYFEITKDKKHPFIVKTKDQETEVLGTHFNINSYLDESVTTTTLIEGSIRVHSLGTDNQALLLPGQQLVLKDEKISIKNADVSQVLAWMNGKIVFKNEALRSIMRKVSRWYGVEIYLDEEVANLKFWGSVSRDSNLSVILNYLKETEGIDYTLVGKNVKVFKKKN